jgi:hypothetical protein
MIDLWSVRRLGSVDARQGDELADLMIDAVNAGASVSFMHPGFLRAVDGRKVDADANDRLSGGAG